MAVVPWSVFWGDGIASTGAYTFLQNKAPIRARARQNVNRDQYRIITALFNNLIGAVTGANVTATHRRVQGPNHADSTQFGAADIGGLRPIELFTDVNRNTVAADVTALKEITTSVNRRPTFPKDLSGNGGGAF